MPLRSDETLPTFVGDLTFIVAESALRQYQELPAPIRKKVRKCIKNYAHHPYLPFHNALAIHKICIDGQWVWQMSVDRAHRLWYVREGRSVRILYIGPHP
jgi:hypothetical protein